MGSLFAPMHLLVLILILILFFGRGRISGVLEELGKGLKSFKKGLEEENVFDQTKKESLINEEEKETLLTKEIENKDKK